MDVFGFRIGWADSGERIKGGVMRKIEFEIHPEDVASVQGCTVKEAELWIEDNFSNLESMIDETVGDWMKFSEE